MDITTENILIIKASQDNKLPFPMAGTSVAIEGQDFVFRTADGMVFKLPFAAQFAGLADNVFSVTFSDGKHLSSGELIENAIDNFKNIDGYLSQNDQVAQPQGEAPVQEKVIVKTVVEKVAIPASEDSPADIGQKELIDAITDYINSEYALSPAEVSNPEQPVIFSSSSSSVSADRHKKDFDYNYNGEYVIPKSQLQLDTLYDADRHTVTVGGGSRTNGGFNEQYGPQVIDLREHHENLTIDARIRGSSDDGSILTRIIRLDSVTTITGITANGSNEYRIVLWSSAEGKALGLAENEFAVVYSTGHGSQFSVGVNFVPPDVTGKSSYDLGFKVSSRPDAVIDSDGNMLLGDSPAPLIIKGGSGNDRIVAGSGNDIYDGGGGDNSIDYSHSHRGITVDFQADNREALKKVGIGDTDSAGISNGFNHQVINNVREIFGTAHNDVFITNGNDHLFHGGKGNDIFISYGGNNLFDGGEGSNTIDYRNTGGIKFEHIKIASLPDSLKGLGAFEIDLNGVYIDLLNNIVINNGWQDGNGQFGQDKLKNINTVYGSKYNDLIIGSEGNDIIYGVAGNDIIRGGKGNDIIDGGSGTSTLDYSMISAAVDVNLNTGIATKGGGERDVLSHIKQIIGAAGGGTLTGMDGASNVLIGTGGYTTFNQTRGGGILIGGKGDNTYHIENANIVVSGHGNSNTLHTDRSLLTYYGSESGRDILYIRSGYSTVYLGKGDTDIFFSEASYNTITSNHGGRLTYHGGNTFTKFYLDDSTYTALDYSAIFNSSLTVDLVGGTIIASDGSTTDTILSGHIRKLIGSKFGHSSFDAHTYTTDIEFVGFGSGNTFSLGTGNNNAVYVRERGTGDEAVTGNYVWIYGGKHNHIEFSSGANNTVDYSHTNGALNIDLGLQIASGNGAGGVDTLIGVDVITGNNSLGSVFKAAGGINCTFNIQGNRDATVYGVETGNAVFNVTSGKYFGQGDLGITAHYEHFSHSLVFDFYRTYSSITKGGGYTDRYNGSPNNVFGTNHGDTINFSNGVNFKSLYFHGGSGNDVINWNTQRGENSQTLIDGGGGYNILNFYGRSNDTWLGFTGSDQQSGGRFSLMEQVGGGYTGHFTNINKVNLSGSGSKDYNVHFNGYSHIDISVGAGIRTVNFYMYGGGNTIDGGGANSTVFYDGWNNSAFTVNLNDGMVRFHDGRASDTLRNIKSIGGSDGNDIITGHWDRANYFYASRGDDVINGNSGTGNTYYSKSGLVNFDMSTGVMTKYSGTGSGILGYDTLSNIQTFQFDNDWRGGMSKVFQASSGSYKFVIVTNADFTFYGVQGSNNTIDHNTTYSGGRVTLDYTNFTDAVTLTFMGRRVDINKGDGSMDSLTSKNGETINTGSGNDIFNWTTWTDLNEVIIDAGSGNDVLVKKAGGDQIANFGSLSNIKNVETLDLTSMTHKFISFDLNGFFNAHNGQNEFTLNIKNADYMKLFVMNTEGWSVYKGSNEDTYTFGDGNGGTSHTFHVHYAAA